MKSYYNEMRKEFGNKIAIYSSLQKIMERMHLYPIQRSIVDYKDKAVLDFLYQTFSSELTTINEHEEFVPKYQCRPLKNISETENCIWTFWWQGEKELPELIKICINSIKKNSNGHRVVVISEENINEWVEIPQFIYEKVKKGQISLTHLSDIVRMALLSIYGGLWIDATVILTAPIDNAYFSYDYFTCKQIERECICISKYRWTGSFLAGKNSNEFFSFIYSCFIEYWVRHNSIIDYFLIDYLTDIAFRESEKFKILYEAVPINNVKMYEAEECINLPYKNYRVQELLGSGSIFKLQRRNMYNDEYRGEKITLYGYWKKTYKNISNT